MQILITDDFIFHTCAKDDLPVPIRTILRGRSSNIAYWRVQSITKHPNSYIIIADEGMIKFETSQTFSFFDIM